MTDAQQRAAAKMFAEFWKGKGYEKGQVVAYNFTQVTGISGCQTAPTRGFTKNRTLGGGVKTLIGSSNVAN